MFGKWKKDSFAISIGPILNGQKNIVGPILPILTAAEGDNCYPAMPISRAA